MNYPEHEKLKKVQDQSRACGAFLDWLLGEKGFHLHIPGELGAHCDVPHQSIQKLLAEYFGIDLDLIETERRQMLDEIRAAQQERGILP